MIIRVDADFKSNFVKFPESTMAKGLRLKRRKGHHYSVLEGNIPVLPPSQHGLIRNTGNKAGKKDHKHTSPQS
jgi:hypothetical protein